MHVLTPAARTRVPDRRRRMLEANGWRTWLSYHENHRRAGDGRMVGVEARWVAELEHEDGRAFVVAAASPAAAWLTAWRQVCVDRAIPGTTVPA